MTNLINFIKHHCANYHNSVNGCLLRDNQGYKCLVIEKQRCAYAESSVIMHPDYKFIPQDIKHFTVNRAYAEYQTLIASSELDLTPKQEKHLKNSIIDNTAPIRTCPDCGTELQKRKRFCPKCARKRRNNSVRIARTQKAGSDVNS